MHRIFEENYTMLLSEMLLGNIDITKYAWIAVDMTEFTQNHNIENRVHVEFFLYAVLPTMLEHTNDDDDETLVSTVWWETPRSEHWNRIYDFDIPPEIANEYLKDKKNLIISIEKFTEATS